MDDVRTALERLRALDDATLAAMCREHRVRVLTLFGSSTDSRANHPGDIDLGVLFEPGARHDLLGLLDDLSRHLRSDAVDLLDAERASDTARMRAIGEGEPLYESERGAFAWAAAAAQTLYLDTAWMREAALDPLSA